MHPIAPVGADEDAVCGVDLILDVFDLLGLCRNRAGAYLYFVEVQTNLQM